MNESLNFIEQIIEEDIASGKHNGEVHTRFPPEPNGFLHIGHTKAICINFETAAKYGGITNLRFDDTNPTTEDTSFVEAIQRDIKWLGFDWEDRLYFASDYFGQLYEFAEKLIENGLAYVDDSTSDEIAEMKGTPNQPGKNSPFRDRSVEENLQLFRAMKNGDFPDGAKVLRAKVDMESPNMLLRDPLIYRIKHAHHHRTGDDWCIYPMYDFAHGQSDSIENITHSLCSLEFIHHRPLYNWFIEKLGIYPSRQIEFARMNVEYMITSKRKLLKLVEKGLVSGWDDARMPTIAGMRRKGYPAAALRTFCDKAGVAKRENLIEIELLESCVRDELNKISDRVHVVIDPLKVIITNYPEGKVEMIEAINNPEDEGSETRMIPFSREIWIEREDFREAPNKKYYRMGPGRNVRLKNGYILHCEDYKKNEETGEIEEIYCTYYENSKSGEDVSGVKAKGTLHFVSAEQAVKCELRLLDYLFTDPTPDGHDDKDFLDFYNEDSIKVVDAYMEPALAKAKEGQYFQFIRNAYFTLDPDSTEDKKIFNRTVALKSSWKK
ncbi:glutamine--tRNA ligase/YqeY domain fusion protein [Portibacter lacus]|uniref:Glutamine--tRNA ligase n=1 Tax=Portibacter lacus TaxID=1099794 RepID=A0AA37WE44_9BACT|nr:glutamine--tRNA ligase/YqeY domain fusion protein [Portibacter lacus]GLR16274.1 glutamine--tRNA ligase [Portibacter lacus]